jgi:phenylpropionate dioxygenase-like ring-hydroxylating dioxygenase large terminal subunit
MIKDQWYPVLESRALRRKPVPVERLGERLVLWRDEAGAAVCLRDRCPHRGAALSRGRIVDGEIECPYHGFRFAAQGQCTLLPVCGAGARIPHGLDCAGYAVREQHGLIWIYWSASQPTTEPPWLDGVPDDWRGTAVTTLEVPVHYTRFVENLFDLYHFPFVHRSLSFGLVGKRIDPINVDVDGERIHMRATLVPDEDKRREVAFTFDVQVRAPGLARIEINPRAYAFMAATPIDAQRTWVFSRYYQGYVRLPLLRALVAWLGLRADWKLVFKNQDLPVLRSQTPAVADAHDCKLIFADEGVAQYLHVLRKLEGKKGAKAGAAPELRAADR